MPKYFEEVKLGPIAAFLPLEPIFRSVVQLFLARIDVLGFVPAYNDKSMTDDVLDDEEEFGIKRAQFRSKICDEESQGGKADTALAALASIAAWFVLFPTLHLLAHTVRAV